MTGSKDLSQAAEMVEQGKILRFDQIFTYYNPSAVQVESGIGAERFLELVKDPSSILITEMYRIAGALKIAPLKLVELLTDWDKTYK